MHLNHINLCSSDVPAMTAVLEAHLGFRTLESGRVPDFVGVLDAGSEYAMLLGEDGSYVVVSQIDDPGEGRSAYPPHFHFGLMQDSEAAVYDKHAELTAAGLEPGPISAGFSVSGATWTAFYCSIGDGLQVEINHRTRSALLDGPDGGRPAGAV